MAPNEGRIVKQSTEMNSVRGKAIEKNKGEKEKRIRNRNRRKQNKTLERKKKRFDV